LKIIIPTYPPHFKWNKLFLQSIKKYCIDYENVKIDFIIERNNKIFFENYINEYKSDNICIKCIEDITNKYSTPKLPSTIWDKYAYQAIKKMMSVIDSDCELNLVLDSENVCVTYFKFYELFENESVIYYCDWTVSDVQNRVLTDSNEIIKLNNNKWFFETSFWIYRKSIFIKLFEQIKINNNLNNSNTIQFLSSKIFFEKNVYDLFMLNNKLNSDIIDQKDCELIYGNFDPLINKSITTEHIITYTNAYDIDKYIQFVNNRKYKIFRTNNIVDNNVIDKIINNTNLIVATLFDYDENFFTFWNNKINE